MRAGGLEPPRAYAQRIFVPATTFAAVAGWSAILDVCGLDYPFTVAFALGAARLVSTPSPVASAAWGLARDCHLTGFPEFEQFYIAGFPCEHSSISLSPLRLPIPPCPRPDILDFPQMSSGLGPFVPAFSSPTGHVVGSVGLYSWRMDSRYQHSAVPDRCVLCQPSWRCLVWFGSDQQFPGFVPCCRPKWRDVFVRRLATKSPE